MRRARTTLAIVAFAAMVGCTVKSPAATPASVQPTLILYSTEATYKLMRDLARRYSAARDQSVVDIRERSFNALMAELDEGDIDYLISNHAPARDDIWAAPLALDGLAIVVNPANSVTALTINDLRAVFSGRERDWSAFGGERIRIRPLSYQPGSDVYHEFRRMVMGLNHITGNALLVPGFDAALQQVRELDGAIGYLPLSRIDDHVRVLSIEGVYPTASSMNDRRYPLRSTMYVIGREAPNADTFHFFGWVQSAAGQAAVSEAYTALP